MDKKILVVGYANQENIYSRNWETSLQKSQIKYTLLGKNEKWKGWVTRIKSYLHFLNLSESNDFFKYTILGFDDQSDQKTVYVLIDVYDILAVGTEKEFLSKWNKYQTPIVIGAEPNCNPSLCRPLQNYPESRYAGTKNRYLNFGMVAGTRLALINFLSWLIEDSKKYPADIWNEQISASKYIDSHPGQVSLDHEMNLIGNIICHPLHGNHQQFGWLRDSNRMSGLKGLRDSEFESTPSRSDGRVEYKGNKYKKSYPVFIHTPSKTIDALQRYQKYGCLILKEDWISPSKDMLITPGYHWIWFAFLIALIILLIIFGTREWIIAGIIITFLILILYLQSL